MKKIVIIIVSILTISLIGLVLGIVNSIQPLKACYETDQGKDLIYSDELTDARKHLKKAIEAAPESQCGKKAKEIIKTNLPIRENIVQEAVILNRDGRRALDIEKYSLAKEKFIAAIKVDPGFEWPYYNLGNVYMNYDDAENAIKQYKQALKINKNYFDAHLSLGHSYLTLGRNYLKEKKYQKALDTFNLSADYYQKALKLHPDANYINDYINDSKDYYHFTKRKLTLLKKKDG